MILSRFGWFMAALLLGAVVLFALFVRIEPDQQAGIVANQPTGSPASEAVDPAASEKSVPLSSRDGAASLIIPVAGVGADQIEDSYGDPRGANRTHEGIDIVAARNTPVLAASDGRISKLFYSNGGGGITLYERSADGRWTYYYAHLAGYAPGIREGMRVKAGQHIAFVGDSGNAPPGVYHLHFGVSRMAEGDGWWQGTPVNPYPLLAGSGRER